MWCLTTLVSPQDSNITCCKVYLLSCDSNFENSRVCHGIQACAGGVLRWGAKLVQSSWMKTDPCQYMKATTCRDMHQKASRTRKVGSGRGFRRARTQRLRTLSAEIVRRLLWSPSSTPVLAPILGDDNSRSAVAPSITSIYPSGHLISWRILFMDWWCWIIGEKIAVVEIIKSGCLAFVVIDLSAVGRDAHRPPIRSMFGIIASSASKEFRRSLLSAILTFPAYRNDHSKLGQVVRRPVDCSTHEPIDDGKPFISSKIYGDRPEAGWGWSTFAEKSSTMIAEGQGRGGSAATCVRLTPNGGLSFWCRWVDTEVLAMHLHLHFPSSEVNETPVSTTSLLIWSAYALGVVWQGMSVARCTALQ